MRGSFIIIVMSLLEQTRGLTVGLTQTAPTSMLSSHGIDGTPNSDVLLALLARNKALEGKRASLVLFF